MEYGLDAMIRLNRGACVALPVVGLLHARDVTTSLIQTPSVTVGLSSGW